MTITFTYRRGCCLADPSQQLSGVIILDVKYLKYVLAIADRKNMTKAAENLYISQSSLSQFLTKLEQEIGSPLFFRAKGELTLTPAGKLYVEAAKKVIQIQKELYQNIASLDKRGHISVGVTSNFGLRMLSEIIPQFKALYPEVTIEISETNFPAVKKMLMEENIDLGIAAALNAAPFEEQTDILREEEVFFAVSRKHPYCLENPSGTITREDLIEHFSHDNFLLSKRGSSLRALSDELFDNYSFSPIAVCETNSISATRSMIAKDAGVAFIAESCSVDRDHIAYYALNPPLYRQNVVIRRKNWVRNEPENVFYSFITEYFSIHTERPYMAENYEI